MRSKVVHALVRRGNLRGYWQEVDVAAGRLPKKKVAVREVYTACGLKRTDPLEYEVTLEWAKHVSCPKCKASEIYRQAIATQFVNRAEGIS